MVNQNNRIRIFQQPRNSKAKSNYVNMLILFGNKILGRKEKTYKFKIEEVKF